MLDAYGHVSVRHTGEPERYLMSRSLAPRAGDRGRHHGVRPGQQPVDAARPPRYLERFIHGEIYKARPDVMAVVHSHSPSVVPFGVTGVPLRPIYHMSAFLGGGAPVFEIRDAGGEQTDMLVRDAALGRGARRDPRHPRVALMRGHGVVVVGARTAERGVPRASTPRSTRGCRRRRWGWAVPSPI